MNDNRYFEDFKPIRNKVRGLPFLPALERLYKLKRQREAVIVPEVSEFLYVCLLAYAEGTGRDLTENDWQRLLRAIRTLHSNSNDRQIGDQVWRWMRTVGLNQLKAHSNYYFHAVYRYYTIFSDPVLSSYIKSRIGIPYEAYFICGLWLHAVFSRELARPRSYFTRRNNGGPLFAAPYMNRTLELLCRPLSDLGPATKAAMTFDADLFNFQGYPHTQWPLFEVQGVLYCFYADHLFKQLGAGIYYLADIPNAGGAVPKAFGDGFERYIGEVLRRADRHSHYRIRPEISYELSRKQGNMKTSDWIIENKSTLVLIECKTKRLGLGAKRLTSLAKEEPRELAELAKAVTQLYKIFDHYQRGLIPDMPFIEGRRFFPLVVTLEEWFAGGPDTAEALTQAVNDQLSALGLDRKIVEEYPFRVYSCDRFETAVQEMYFAGFGSYFDHLQKGTLTQALQGFAWQPMFEAEYEALFIDPHRA